MCTMCVCAGPRRVQAGVPISFVGVDVPEMLGWPFSSLSGVMVDVDGDLAKLVRGPRWVSFNSVGGGQAVSETAKKGGKSR